jgi:hypothetical protein
MKKLNSKAVDFIYQDTQIHFLLSNSDNVMVNATEMAKAFNRRIDFFLKTEPTKAFINALEFPPIGGNSESISRENLIQTRGQNGTYFHRILAIKFAAWLDPNFEVWIYSTIDKILFGHYKEHWDAHVLQEKAKEKMEKAKRKLLLDANQEDAIAYFEAENQYKTAKNLKQKAIQMQYKLFDLV